MKNAVLSLLPDSFPWKSALRWYDTIGSTNDEAKRLAQSGAAHGTVLLAGHQTGGRGRMGRSFHSPAGKGIYLSVILRPNCLPTELMHLTCAAGVAMCDAVAQTAGFRPGIKWTNDLVWQTKKMGGILTELSVDPITGLVRYAIVGIGINCNHTTADFPPELQGMASSLSEVSGRPVNYVAVAAAMVQSLHRMDGILLQERAHLLQAYRKDCITLGQQIVVIRGAEYQYGTALDVDEEGGLVVHFTDGTVKTVTSGEVSVRGMYGYISPNS